MVRAKRAPYVSPRVLPERLMRESAEAQAGMPLDSKVSEIIRLQSSRRYQNAIKAKFELDYIDASGNIKIENTFVYNVYRVARSSLKAADKRLMINTLVERERSSGRELEVPEREFVGLARFFIGEVLESNVVKERDAKLLFSMYPALAERVGGAQAPQTLVRMGGIEFMESFGVLPKKPSDLVRMERSELMATFGEKPKPRAVVSENASAVPLRTRATEEYDEVEVPGTRVHSGEHMGMRQTSWYRRFVMGVAEIGVVAMVFFHGATGKNDTLSAALGNPSRIKQVPAKLYLTPTDLKLRTDPDQFMFGTAIADQELLSKK
jgi:hypothetical protein